jgi:hypothetical protein
MAPRRGFMAAVAADGGIGLELPPLADGAAQTTVSFGLR